MTIPTEMNKEEQQLTQLRNSIFAVQQVIEALMANPTEEMTKQAQTLEASLTANIAKYPDNIRNQVTVPCLAMELSLKQFVSCAPTIKLLKDDVRKIVGSLKNYPVLIHGESGVGKELIARALHGRKTGKFIAMNCAALSPDLIASELFGHKKGSFTGAIEDKVGLFQAAFNGTLFLDEIGDMNLDLQAKLLRVIQESRIRRLGDTEEIKINCQIVCASHRRLGDMVESGAFRLDLHRRLSVLELTVPPLRERAEDIPLICKSLNRAFPIAEGLKTMELKGNVRDLQAMIARWEVFGRL